MALLVPSRGRLASPVQDLLFPWVLFPCLSPVAYGTSRQLAVLFVSSTSALNHPLSYDITVHAVSGPPAYWLELSLHAVPWNMPRHALPHLTTPYPTMTHQIVPHCAMPSSTTLCHATPHHTISHYTTSDYTTVYHAMPFQTMPCHTVPLHDTSYHTMPSRVLINELQRLPQTYPYSFWGSILCSQHLSWLCTHLVGEPIWTPFLTSFFLDFIHSFMRMNVKERGREKQRHRQREKQAPCREPDVGLDSRSPGSHSGLKAGTNPLSHPGMPPWLLRSAPSSALSLHFEICSSPGDNTTPFLAVHLSSTLIPQGWENCHFL